MLLAKTVPGHEAKLQLVNLPSMPVGSRKILKTVISYAFGLRSLILNPKPKAL